MRKLSKTSRRISLLALSTLTLAVLAGCNLYALIDKPSGDAQILSAARACLDEGDFECARQRYAELTSTEYADIRASEEAFTILAENGADMGAFMETFGSGGGGQALTTLAERIAPGSASKRVNIQNAFKKYNTITGNPSLRALVRFVGSVALAAEFFSEEIAAAGGTLSKTAIATQGSSCNSSTCGCTVPGSAKIQNPGGGAPSVNLLTADISGSISLMHLDAAMSEMQASLNDLGASGGFNSGAGNMASQILSQDPAAAAPCYRGVLIELGIGR